MKVARTPPDGSARIALLGAGHANLLAVRRLRHALPDARITLIDAAPHAIYSGLVPAAIAGAEPADAASLDLGEFAARRGILFRQGRAIGLDVGSRRIALAEGVAVTYDIAAIDIGSHSAIPEIEGFARHAVAVKPLQALLRALHDHAEGEPGGAIAVIGAGLAGIELALALRRSHPVTLIEAGPSIAPGVTLKTRTALRAALDRAGVTVLTGKRVIRVTAGAVHLQDGLRLASTLTLGAAGARAQGWMARDLPSDERGFLRIGPTLQVEGHTALFAAGDCATMIHAPRAKAGVFAVRQAPILAHNITALLRGTPLRSFTPQTDYLKLVGLADGTALAEWRGWSLRGRWLSRLKRRIDKGYLDGLLR